MCSNHNFACGCIGLSCGSFKLVIGLVIWWVMHYNRKYYFCNTNIFVGSIKTGGDTLPLSVCNRTSVDGTFSPLVYNGTGGDNAFHHRFKKQPGSEKYHEYKRNSQTLAPTLSPGRHLTSLPLSLLAPSLSLNHSPSRPFLPHPRHLVAEPPTVSTRWHGRFLVVCGTPRPLAGSQRCITPTSSYWEGSPDLPAVTYWLCCTPIELLGM